MVRIEDCAEPSLAARFDESKLGMAMAAMMPIIATTMRSSISEKPSWRFVLISFMLLFGRVIYRCDIGGSWDVRVSLIPTMRLGSWAERYRSERGRSGNVQSGCLVAQRWPRG